MSTSEIKKTAEGLTPEERAYLASYLRVLDRIQEADYLEELARRKRDIEQGKLLAVSPLSICIRPWNKRACEFA